MDCTATVTADVADRPLASYALAAAAGLDDVAVVVLAAQPEPVRAWASFPVAGPADLADMLAAGTGRDTVVVVRADAPLLTTASLRTLVDQHRAGAHPVTLLTAPSPAVSPEDWLAGHDADRAADPRLTAAYAFDPAVLRKAGSEPPEDLLAWLVDTCPSVGKAVAGDWRDTIVVADEVSLGHVRRVVRDRLLRAWMLAGVAVVDPATAWIGADVVLEPGVTIERNTRLAGQTVVRAGATVGPDAALLDTVVGAGTQVRNASCQQVELGPANRVGPYVFLRNGARTADGVSIGAFVEIKATRIGAQTAVPHFACLIDGAIGERCNIGAFSGIANYDGVNKHHAIIGDDVMLAGGTAVMAPARIGAGAVTAAGAVVTKDVPPGALAISRVRQVNVEGWVESRMPGSPAARAVRRALSEAADRDA